MEVAAEEDGVTPSGRCSLMGTVNLFGNLRETLSGA
jgi:hypothetical protein